MSSPYFGKDEAEGEGITRALVRAHPLSPAELINAVEEAWAGIFGSSIGVGARIGQHIFPKPQIMGFLLHELIPLALERDKPSEWRAERTASDKDIVYIPNDKFSIEVKTSAHASQIFANRSYGQEAVSEGKKAKSGYYLAVNFEPWPVIERKPLAEQYVASLVAIRFGWLDHTDWLAQASATGQQASLPIVVDNLQLLRLAG